MRIERFINALVRPLYKEMAPKMKSFPSYSIVVDCVKMLEIKEIEAHALQEKTKKHKTEHTYGSQSDGTFNKGSKP